MKSSYCNKHVTKDTTFSTFKKLSREFRVALNCRKLTVDPLDKLQKVSILVKESSVLKFSTKEWRSLSRYF